MKPNNAYDWRQNPILIRPHLSASLKIGPDVPRASVTVGATGIVLSVLFTQPPSKPQIENRGPG